jgi:uncharacterized protein (TIGR03086 family)
MVNGMTDIAILDRRAVEVSQTIVDQVDVAQLDLPTPCAEWNLGQLLAHMIGQHYGFAASARGESSDLTIFQPRPLGADPAKDYAESVATLTAAFAEEGILGRKFWLPEIRDGGPFAAPLGISFHFVDYVVHAWDVAAAIGVPVAFDEDLLQAALRIAEMVPNGPERRDPGAAFRPAKMPEAGASTLDRIIILLGRSPDWPDEAGA